jgi:hypothetical protein
MVISVFVVQLNKMCIPQKCVSLSPVSYKTYISYEFGKKLHKVGTQMLASFFRALSYILSPKN